MKFCPLILTRIFCLASLSLAIAPPIFAKPIAPPEDPNQPGSILKTPRNTTPTDLNKINNGLKPKLKYSVVKSCNQGEFLFLKESTKKSGFPYWQVRLSDGKADTKDILVATDARFSLVQNQTKGLAPVVLSEIRSYGTKDLMQTDLKSMSCQ